jgi:hypothetical protein
MNVLKYINVIKYLLSGASYEDIMITLCIGIFDRVPKKDVEKIIDVYQRNLNVTGHMENLSLVDKHVLAKIIKVPPEQVEQVLNDPSNKAGIIRFFNNVAKSHTMATIRRIANSIFWTISID